MPTSSTSIITGDPTGNINSILASNGYDKTGDNRNNSVYARVLNVFEDKSIIVVSISSGDKILYFT